jgi:protein involved in sex pheromone biosynthesis
MKITTFSMLSIASLALLLSACGNAVNTTTNNSTTNTANKSNTAVVTNSNQPAVKNTATVSNTASNAAGNSAGDRIQGELQVGKSESVILYVGKETGDYAGYCFTNDSEAGRAILAACKNREQCEVIGTVDNESGCQVPGLEADLSASGKIAKVESAKSLGSRK